MSPAAVLAGTRPCAGCSSRLLAAGYSGDLCPRCLRGLPTGRRTRPLLPSTRAARKRIAAQHLQLPVPPPGRPYTLEQLGEPVVAFTVHGIPGPQGSKSSRGRNPRTGKMVMVESSEKVKPWRAAVAAAARLALPADWQPVEGPLVASMVFTVPPPKSGIPKDRCGSPSVYPDLSKYARSTEDALTQPKGEKAATVAALTSLVWKDDGQIVDYYRLRKFYTSEEDPEVLDQPGAVIRVWRRP